MIRSSILTLILAAASSAAPVYLSVNNNNPNDNRLVTVDAGTGAINDVGGLGLTNVDIEGLALNPTNFALYGIDDNQSRFISINPATGAGTPISTFSFDVDDAGLAFSSNGTLYFANTRTGDTQFELYTVNPATGAATLVGALSQKVNDLAFFGSTLYGLGNTELLTVNPTTAAITSVGALGRTVLDGDLVFDVAGNGYGVRDLAPDNSGSTEIFQINRLTGAASGGITVGSANNPITLETLTSPTPEPATMFFVSAALVGLGLTRRRWKNQ